MYLCSDVHSKPRPHDRSANIKQSVSKNKTAVLTALKHHRGSGSRLVYLTMCVSSCQMIYLHSAMSERFLLSIKQTILQKSKIV